MKRVAVLALMLLVHFLPAQTYEAGVFLGGSNYIGDIGPTNYIAPNDIAVGGVFKWNISKRYSWRASAIYSKIHANDIDSDMASRIARDYEFENTLKEFSVGLEFNFLDFNLHKMQPVFTPYIYTGATYTFYESQYFVSGNAQKIGNKATFAIPMTLGLKTNISSDIILGAEIGARYTFTDNLDGSNPESGSLENVAFGNVFSDDWYVFSGVTVTYTFGRKPCYDCVE